MWHGYFVVERLNIGAANWATLQGMFEAMGTHGSPFPCYNNHRRTRLDGNAVIYESLFDPDEVSVQQFKQLLATTFGVPVEDILHVTTYEDYVPGDPQTTVWTFYYDEIVPGEDRFKVERFGNGGTRQESRAEARGYLDLYLAEWEEAQ